MHKSNNQSLKANCVRVDQVNELIHELSLIQEYYQEHDFQKLDSPQKKNNSKKSNYKIHKSIQQQLIGQKIIDSSDSDEPCYLDKNFMTQFQKTRQDRKIIRKIEKKFLEKINQTRYV